MTSADLFLVCFMLVLRLVSQSYIGHFPSFLQQILHQYYISLFSVIEVSLEEFFTSPGVCESVICRGTERVSRVVVVSSLNAICCLHKFSRVFLVVCVILLLTSKKFPLLKGKPSMCLAGVCVCVCRITALTFSNLSLPCHY